MNINLNQAQEKDIPILLQFIKAYHSYDHIDFDLEKAEKALHPLILDEHIGRAWIVTLDQTNQIGYILLTFGYSMEYCGRDAFFDEFFIEEKYRGQGIGRVVLEKAIVEAKKLGVKQLYLEVERHNIGAEHLYESIGFYPRARYHLLTMSLTKE